MGQSLQEQNDELDAKIAAQAGRFSFTIYERAAINGDKNVAPKAPCFISANMISDGGPKWCIAVTDRVKLPTYTNVVK